MNFFYFCSTLISSRQVKCIYNMFIVIIVIIIIIIVIIETFSNT